MSNDIDSNKTLKEVSLTSGSFLLSLFISVFIFFLSLVLGEIVFAKSFAMGAIVSLLYFRMQNIFANNFYKKDLLSRLISVLSMGRIFIVAALLYVAFKRQDVFQPIYIIGGIMSVHLSMMLGFIFKIVFHNKKKLNFKTLS